MLRDCLSGGINMSVFEWQPVHMKFCTARQGVSLLSCLLGFSILSNLTCH